MTGQVTYHVRRAILPASAGLAAVAILTAIALLLVNTRGAQAAQAPVGLGTAANFSVLAGSTVTNTGPSFLAQDLGVSPGSFGDRVPTRTRRRHHPPRRRRRPPGQERSHHRLQRRRRPHPFTNLPAELGGSTLIHGVYRIGAAQLTGQLTLDSQGDPAAVFIFQIDSTLVTAANSSVVFINGASPATSTGRSAAQPPSAPTPPSWATSSPRRPSP